MEIISWNCNDGFQNKFKELEPADIYVIQEVRDPRSIEGKEFQNWLKDYDYKWVQHWDKSRGLCVFIKKDINYSENSWNNFGLDCYISLKINDINFIAVWACDNYIEDACIYFDIHKEKLGKAFIVGDFNSNVIWNGKRKRNHSYFSKMLSSIGIKSIYHKEMNENEGSETISTFYLHRNENKDFHIDYMFAHDDIKYNNFKIGDVKKYLKYSDHVPMSIDIQI